MVELKEYEHMRQIALYWMNKYEDLRKYLDDSFYKDGDMISITEINKFMINN